jgi:hypothetical protein
MAARAAFSAASIAPYAGSSDLVSLWVPHTFDKKALSFRSPHRSDRGSAHAAIGTVGMAKAGNAVALVTSERRDSADMAIPFLVCVNAPAQAEFRSVFLC